MRSVLLAVPVAAVALVTSACSASPVTAGRVEHAVGPAFARLYVTQQHELGHDVVTRPDGHASCRRGATDSPTRGSGDDWTCTVNFPFPDGHVQPISYDLEVQAGGCYTASGPAQVVGPQHQTDAAGRAVTNPLFQFDGCFDVT